MASPGSQSDSDSDSDSDVDGTATTNIINKNNASPNTSKYPTTLADHQFLETRHQHHDGNNKNDEDDYPDPDKDIRNLYKTIKSLRVATLSIRNRLVSIQSDSRFVQEVAAHFGGLPLIANERCGSWYIPPWHKAGSVYFKSTDGHHGQWAFSLRRLNLNLLGILGGGSNSSGDNHGENGNKKGAAMIVDSTRRGKRVPDALAKTVGIWSAVINAVLFPEYRSRYSKVDLWHDVGRSERAQIEAKLDTWCKAFASLGLDLPKLRDQVKRPIRCLWVVNGEFTPEDDDSIDQDEDEDEDDQNHYDYDHYDEDYAARRKRRLEVIRGWKRGDWNLLVLCSASRVVKGAEMSQGGYIQGSGDDHEAWSHGLTADLFWTHKDRLEAILGDDDMEAEIEQLVKEDRERRSQSQAQAHTCTQAHGGNYSCVDKVGTIYIGAGPVRHEDVQGGWWDLVIECQGQMGESETSNENKKETSNENKNENREQNRRVLRLNCRTGKLGSKDLREKLSLVQVLDIATIFESKQTNCHILITCDSGKDLSVGVAVVLLCLYYGHDGKLEQAGSLQGERNKTRVVDKQLVKQRLAWITSSKPDANPSRATLQAVNSYLMQRPV